MYPGNQLMLFYTTGRNAKKRIKWTKSYEAGQSEYTGQYKQNNSDCAHGNIREIKRNQNCRNG